MDNSNLRPTTTEAEPMDATDDWRTTLQPDDRQKHVNKIMETLKKQLPVSSPEGLVEIATTFEEKMYKAATSQADYLRKISMTLLAMETKSQTIGTANTKQSNDGIAQKPPNPASDNMQSQEHNQGQSQIPLPKKSQAPQQLSQAQQQLFQAQQQLLSRNVQILQNTIANTGFQSSARLPYALSSVTNLTQTAMAYAAGQSTNMQSGIAQNSVGNSISQGLPPNILSLAHLMRARQQSQQIAPQQQQQQSLNPQLLYLQQRQLEQQFQHFQVYQRWINQQMQHLQQQQQQVFQMQQIPQLQQQFQKLALQQQSVQLNGGAYYPFTTTPELFQVTSPLENFQQHSFSSPQIHDQQQQQQRQKMQQSLLPIS